MRLERFTFQGDGSAVLVCMQVKTSLEQVNAVCFFFSDHSRFMDVQFPASRWSGAK